MKKEKIKDIGFTTIVLLSIGGMFFMFNSLNADTAPKVYIDKDESIEESKVDEVSISSVVAVAKNNDKTKGLVYIEGSNKKYRELQEAVDAATSGATLLMEDGTYKAGVKLNKNITIKAANGAKNVLLTGEKSVVGWKYDESKRLYYAPSPCMNIDELDVHDRMVMVEKNGKKEEKEQPSIKMSGVQALFINGEEKSASRYPNSGYLTVKDSPSKSKFSLENFNMTNADIIDSIAHVRMSQWRLASRRVKSYEGGYLNLESKAISDGKNITPQFKVFFTQVLGAIDTDDEWAWHKNRIYLKSSTEPKNVTVACREHGIYLDAGAKKVTISGLKITKIRGNGIDKKNDTRKSKEDTLIVKNNTISYVSGWGIALRDFYKRYERLPADTVVRGNSVHHARTGGIKVFADNAIIDSNYIHDIGASTLDDDVLSFGDAHMLTGIFVMNSSGAKVFNNRVDRVGYNGISLSNSWSGWLSNGDRIVENNYISNALLALNDGGCIYAYVNKMHNIENSKRAVERDIIRNNIIENCTGSYAATNDVDTSFALGEGIYLDNDSSHVDVYNNTVISATKSLYINRGFDINAKENTLILPYDTSIYLGDIRGEGDRKNVYIENNNILSKEKLTYKTIHDKGQKYLTRSDSNTIRVDKGTNVKIRDGYGLKPNVSFSQWKEDGYDVHSLIIKDSTLPVVLINPSSTYKVFSHLEGCKKFDNSPLGKSSATVDAYESLVLFGCTNRRAGTYRK